MIQTEIVSQHVLRRLERILCLHVETGRCLVKCLLVIARQHVVPGAQIRALCVLLLHSLLDHLVNLFCIQFFNGNTGAAFAQLSQQAFLLLLQRFGP